MPSELVAILKYDKLLNRYVAIKAPHLSQHTKDCINKWLIDSIGSSINWPFYVAQTNLGEAYLLGTLSQL
jgi:hypothetical protein